MRTNEEETHMMFTTQTTPSHFEVEAAAAAATTANLGEAADAVDTLGAVVGAPMTTVYH